jgi:alpha-galactosidase
LRAVTVDSQSEYASLVVDAEDRPAELALRTEVQSLPGGGLRIRHTLTNTGTAPYLVDGLDVVVPVDDRYTEFLDFTGRHERERVPQRQSIADGLWLRESRHGRTGHDAATVLAAGTPGFGFGHGEVLAVHVAWSGNTVVWLERTAATPTTVGGGELLQPGELVLQPGEAYAAPWVHVVAAADGLDGVAAAFHGWLRSRPAHPGPQPVTLNVWEAVYVDHDQAKLFTLAERAAQVGVERFVLDDGWFGGRRDDTAGLGDWWIAPEVWPRGLTELIQHVRGLGMQFGLWIEPEMVNPDSDLYRAHPDWILAAGDRVPVLQRNQLVLDLTRPEVRAHLSEQIGAVLAGHDISFVKWDHNRDLLEAGTGRRAGAAAVHEQTLAYYALLDQWRAEYPAVHWESCAGGGGRIDLGVLDRVQRVWTSDMTDALARQAIQRWTGQLVAPEYLGAHVSAPVSHQTGRTLSLAFRAGTALFGSFGIEWDLTSAGPEDLAELAGWVARYRQHRQMLHSGRMVRLESSDPAVWLHGVIAADRRSALLAHVQLDESRHNRGVQLRVPGLDPARSYRPAWAAPVEPGGRSGVPPLDPAGPAGGQPLTGAQLAAQGLWIPRRHPESIALIELTALSQEDPS